MFKQNKRRPTIGLQITNLHEEYPKLIWQGVLDMAQEKDADIIIFRGEALYNPYSYGYQLNVIYDLMRPDYLDALIIASGTLCNYSTKENFYTFIENLKDIPLISLSIPLKNIPSILVDNSNGIEEAVKHLVSVHHRKKIAFISGPENNEEAQIRLKAYIESMRKYGIKADDNLIVPGNFDEISGRNAVKELLDYRKAFFDGLIAANDTMAIEAVNELSRRGIDVPDEAAVIGFDNIMDCEIVSPPLTTIKQPIYQQGKKAVELALDIINGKDVPPEVILPTSLLIRSSCGCFSSSAEIFRSINTDEKEKTSHCGEEADRVKLYSEIRKIIDLTDFIGPKSFSVSDLLDDLLLILEDKNLTEDNITVFLKKLNKKLNIQKKEGINISFWPGILNILYCYINKISEQKKEIDRLFQSAFNIIQDIQLSIQITERIQRERLELKNRDVINTFQTSFTQEELFNNIALNFPKLTLTSCYVFIYDNIIRHKRNQKWQFPGKVNLSLAFDIKTNTRLIKINNNPVSPFDFIPQEYYDQHRRHTYMATPLFYLEDQYGYIVYELDLKYGNIYEFLTQSICNTFIRIQLMSQLEEEQYELKKRNLEMENDILLARRIQSQLIPAKSPKPNIAFCYKPMEKIGGDFFDFLEFREKNWVGIFVSDVSGHGVPAAFVTSMVKSNILQTRLLQDNPAFLLQLLNESLINQTGDNFATAFYGIYKFDSKEFIYANAGHNMPYIIRDNKIEQISSYRRGLPLAILSNELMLKMQKGYQNQTISLKPGSKLILYTDGLTEAVNQKNMDEDFESASLQETFLKFQKTPANIFVAETYLKLVEFHGSDDFQDDVCIICVNIE